jgi:uncharacterized protein (DUF2342 family)
MRLAAAIASRRRLAHPGSAEQAGRHVVGLKRKAIKKVACAAIWGGLGGAICLYYRHYRVLATARNM